MYTTINPQVTVPDLTPAAETVTIEFPTDAPNPDLDGGAFAVMNGGSAVIPMASGEDRGYVNGVVEDPLRQRLLCASHNRDDGDTDNRRIHFWSSSWGQPGQPWTRLNPKGSPALDVTADVWQAGNVYSASLCVVGDTLYFVYSGTEVGAINKCKIGMGTADLSGGGVPTSVTRLTTANPLQLGSTPYEGYAASLSYLNGQFYLWVNQDTDGVTNPVNLYGPAFCKLYTCPTFSATGSDWVLQPGLYEYGGINSRAIDWGLWQMLPLDGSGKSWVGTEFADTLGTGNFRATTIKFADETITAVKTGNFFSGGATGDSPRLFFHNGDWYLFYVSGSEGYVAKYGYGSQYPGSTATTGKKFQRYVRNVYATTVSNAGGYADVDCTADFKKLDKVVLETSVAAGRLITVAGLNTTVAGTADGKFLTRIYDPTAAHQHQENDVGGLTDANAAMAGTNLAGVVATMYVMVWGQPV